MLLMDSREAVTWLDIYSDDLVSLSLVLRASTLQDDTDDEICEVHEDLKIAIVEKQKQAMLLARDILTTKNRRGGTSDSLIDELSAAIQRYVLADKKASDALKPLPETYAQALARTHREAATREKEANPVSPNTVNDVGVASAQDSA